MDRPCPTSPKRFRPLWRRVALLTTLVAALSGASAPGASAALPPQGLYESCAPRGGSDLCPSRLRKIASGGFTRVLNYGAWGGDLRGLEEYIAEAERLGIQLIWPLNHPDWRNGGDLIRRYPGLAADCGCSDRTGFIQFVTSVVRHRGATWGWYIGDEVPLDQVEAVRALSALIRGLDPAHPQLYIAHENSGTRGRNLEPFAGLADLVGADFYPVGMGDTVEVVGELSASVQSLASRNGRQSAFVLQSFSWAAYPQFTMPDPRWPTRDEMQRMRDLALQHAQPGLILWYSMQDLERADDPALRWSNLVSAAFAPEPPPLPPPPSVDTNGTTEAPPARESCLQRVRGSARTGAARRAALRSCYAQNRCRARYAGRARSACLARARCRAKAGRSARSSCLARARARLR
ncbi:MAG TPA: hypothetical protein VNT32_09365 [Thermoleophilaceae bacterium]|nr:hypothetical protein [Thermoleophilaceae bacterium]